MSRDESRSRQVCGVLDEEVYEVFESYREDAGIRKSEAVRRLVEEGLVREGYPPESRVTQPGPGLMSWLVKRWVPEGVESDG